MVKWKIEYRELVQNDNPSAKFLTFVIPKFIYSPWGNNVVAGVTSHGSKRGQLNEVNVDKYNEYCGEVTIDC